MEALRKILDLGICGTALLVSLYLFYLVMVEVRQDIQDLKFQVQQLLKFRSF